MGGASWELLRPGAGAHAKCGRNAKTMRGEAAIGAIENAAQNRQKREEIQRPRPPDAPHDIAIDVSPLNLPAIGQHEAQVLHKQRVGQIQPPPRPFALKRCDFKSSAAKSGRPERYPAAAEAA